MLVTLRVDCNENQSFKVGTDFSMQLEFEFDWECIMVTRIHEP